MLSFELERAPKIANQLRVFQIFELGAQNSFQFKNLCSSRHLLFFRFLFGFIQFSSKFNKILKKNADIALLHTATNTIAQGMKTALILTSLVYLYFNALYALSMPENCFCLSTTCEHAMANSPTVVELVT